MGFAAFAGVGAGNFTVTGSLNAGCACGFVTSGVSVLFGFCAPATPAIIAIAKMPVISFIAIPYLFTVAGVVPGVVPGLAPAPAPPGAKS